MTDTQMESDTLPSPLRTGMDEPMDTDTPSSSGPLNLGGVDLSGFNKKMKEHSDRLRWRDYFGLAGDDAEMFRFQLPQVLQHLTMELAHTDLKDAVIKTMSAADAANTATKLDNEELEQWKIGLWDGIKKNDWRKLIQRPSLHVASPSEESIESIINVEDQETATQRSWEHEFRGDAAEGLWQHILKHHRPDDTDIYAQYAAIVQSSGMGKSRTVDELAKKCFVLPLNLRQEGSSGYPPPDRHVRDYLIPASSRTAAFSRASAFLEALFKHAADYIHLDKSSNYVGFARTFRERMTEGQTMASHNKFRREFYSQVIDKAEALLQEKIQNRATGNHDSPLYSAFKALDDLLQDQWLQEQKTVKPQESPRLVVLAFDEAHTLTERQPTSTGDDWSIFNELRRVLRALNGLPLFSLFLSTTGKVSQFASAAGEDLSMRVVKGDLRIIEPYTDLGFDHLAHKISLDGSWTLERLTEDDQICSLGRPLFATRNQYGTGTIKLDIIRFAAAKLLNADRRPSELSADQHLACLSQRIPIEFNSTNYMSQRNERKQVEGHMRVCLKIDSAFETMVTTSSSEPILSEAAYYVMQGPSFAAPQALKQVMQGFSISKGDRGEFLVLLLLILARDAAVGPADPNARPETGKRWIGMADFLYGHVFRKHIIPSGFIDQHTIDALNGLSKDFGDAHIYFTHFAKVHEYKAIDITSLLLLKGRGAAVLCANSQAGVDAINVFLVKGTQLVRDNAGLILHQVKNDSRYSATPKQKLFDDMDPYGLEILEENAPAVPLVKIVFALAATKPCLKVVRHDSLENYNAVVYEIWCAGLSKDILGPIEQTNVGVWDALLQASFGWKELYKTPSVVTSNLRRTATPGAARDAAHYSSWAER